MRTKKVPGAASGVARASEGSVEIYLGDLPERVVDALIGSRLVAIDTETSGLDFESDQLNLVQIFSPSVGVCFLRVIEGQRPEQLDRLLVTASVKKVFHHAMFDLRFLRSKFGIRARNVACTKVLAKIAYPANANTSLKSLVKEFLGREIDKSMRLSNWGAASLSREQVDYAAGDVVCLPPLFRAMRLGVNRELWGVVAASYRYIPTRVELDVSKIGDVFVY